MSLSAKPLDEMQCFKRIVCIVGATGGSLQKVDNDAEIIVTKNQPLTLAKGIEQFVNMLHSMTETIETDMDEFPIIQQIIGRYIYIYMIFCWSTGKKTIINLSFNKSTFIQPHRRSFNKRCIPLRNPISMCNTCFRS